MNFYFILFLIIIKNIEIIIKNDNGFYHENHEEHNASNENCKLSGS